MLNCRVVEVLNPSMGLQAFDEHSLLSSPPQMWHAVHKVRAGTAWYALKEFTLADS